MKKFIKPVIFIAIGIFIAFPIFSLSYYTMVRTSTPEFCASCHEIQPAYNSWKTSTHANNDKGFTADCMDCHLPAPQDTFNFFYAKTAHGIKDVFVHFAYGTYDREASRNHAYATFKNAQCQKCHQNILYIPNKRGAMLAHRSVVYPKKGYEKKCVDCHRDLVHVDSDVFRYRESQQPYRGLGL